MSIKIKKIRRMAVGGETGLTSRDKFDNFSTNAGSLSSGYYGTQMGRSEDSGEVAYNAGMSAVSKAGPIGGIIGGATAVGSAVYSPIKNRAEQIDPETGGYKNLGNAQASSTVRNIFNPFKAGTELSNDPNAKWWEHVGAWTGMGFTQIGTRKRKDKEMREAKFKEDYSNMLRKSSGTYNNPYTPIFPYGGKVGQRRVELEKGEPFRTPDGDISSISENAPTHNQGGVPITLPEGTEVLGKKKTIDGEKFKKVGKELEKLQDKYEKILDNHPTAIARRTAERMLKNVQDEYTNLFEEQGEDTGSQQMPEGGVITLQRGISTPSYRNLTPTTFRQQLTRKGILGEDYNDLSPDQINEKIRSSYKIKEGFALPYRVNTNKDGTLTYQKDYGREEGEWYSPEGTGEVVDTYNNPRTKYSGGGRINTNPLGQNDRENWYDVQEPLYEAPNYPNYNMNENVSDSQLIPYANEMTERPVAQEQNNRFDYGSALREAGSLSPMLYNIGQGMKPSKKLNKGDFYNPYMTDIRDTMRDRRYNINPELRSAERSRATHYRQLLESGPSASQLYGGMQMGTIAKNRAVSEAVARKQNVDNQYLGEQARMDATLGQGIVQSDFRVEEINEREAAARRNYMSTGLSQLSQYSQTKQLMNNQMVRDAQRLNLLPSLIKSYDFDAETGMWKFKKTGEMQTTEEAWNYINSNK